MQRQQQTPCWYTRTTTSRASHARPMLHGLPQHSMGLWFLMQTLKSSDNDMPIPRKWRPADAAPCCPVRHLAGCKCFLPFLLSSHSYCLPAINHVITITKSSLGHSALPLPSHVSRSHSGMATSTGGSPKIMCQAYLHWCRDTRSVRPIHAGSCPRWTSFFVCALNCYGACAIRCAGADSCEDSLECQCQFVIQLRIVLVHHGQHPLIELL